MNPIRPAALDPDRLAHFLPFLFAALLFTGVAMQAKLLPVKPMRMEFPSDADVPTGAAPQQSVAPPSGSLSFDVPTAVLPRESVSDETVPAYSTPSAATVAPSLEPALAGAAAGVAMSPALGAGNLAFRPNRAHAVSVLLANLMETIQHLRAKARLSSHPSRRLTAVKTLPHSAKQPTSITGAATKASPLVAGLGGSAPPMGVLGGPAPFGAKLAPSVNGSTIRRKF